MPERDLPAWRRLRRRAWWLLLVAVAAVMERLPLAASRAFGRALAAVGLRTRTRERSLARANLELAFPEMSPAARERLLAESSRRLGENLADTLAVRHLLDRPRFVAENVAENVGGNGDGRPLGQVLAELAAPGRGVLVLGGHLGCWELLGAWLAREVSSRDLGRLGTVTGTVHNPPVDRWLQDRRRNLGMHVLPREAGVRPLLRHFRSGGIAAVLVDQRTRVRNAMVPFFGRTAPTPVGPVRLARRYGIPILPMGIGRHGQGHRVVHLPPLDPARYDEAGLLAACNEALEDMIRRNPAEWVWFHRRWENADDDR